MSDELPETGSDPSPSEVALTGPSNGVHHDDSAAVATAIAPETKTAEDEIAEDEIADGDAPTDADAITSDASAGTPDDAPDDGSGFLADLVKAMQTTAASERARLGEDADRRRDAHVAAVETRRAAEVGRMRELAADDLKSIDAWAEDERQRIQAEHDRRAAALQTDLETSLAQHAGRIERELAVVHGAVAKYRADVDAFFASLDRESDPVAIARQASQRPAFPALEAIGAAASAETADAVATGPSRAGAETTNPEDAAGGSGVGVMADPATLAHGVQALAGKLAASREAAPAESARGLAPASSDTTADPDATADKATEVAHARVTSGSRTPVLESVPISRPMSWLRRDRDQDHPER